MGFQAGGLGFRPPAAEEILQFWGQNIAIFVYFLIDFSLYQNEDSAELIWYKWAITYTLFDNMCSYNSVLNYYIR